MGNLNDAWAQDIGKILNDCGFSYKGTNCCEELVFSKTRDYAIPECVGCMVQIEYLVSCNDGVKNKDKVFVQFQSIMFTRKYESESTMYLNSNEKCIVLYNDIAIYNMKSKYDELNMTVWKMLQMSELKVKNVLGMQRIA